MRLRKDGKPDLRAGRKMPKGVECCNFKHGHAINQSGKSPEYRSWRAMLARCNNPRDPAFARYGGRGIEVDSYWLKFTDFLADMGPRPKGTSIERVDNNGPYTKANCIWGTRYEQGANMKSNYLISVDGKIKHLREWARQYGLDPATIKYRIEKLGWSPQRAVTEPKMRRRTGTYSNALISELPS